MPDYFRLIAQVPMVHQVMRMSTAVLVAFGLHASAQVGPVRIQPLPAHAIIAVGDPPLQFSASLKFFRAQESSEGNFSSITPSVWSSSNPAAATIDSATGLATAKAAGTTTITALGGPFQGSTTLTVVPAPLVSVAVNPSSVSIPKGESQPFTATGTFSDSSTQDITNSVTWSSSDTSVATVSNLSGTQGLAFAVSNGSAMIFASANGKQGTAALTVTPAQLVSVAIAPASADILPGQTQQFTATGLYTDASNKVLPFAGDAQHLAASLAWASSDTTLAPIDSNGLVSSSNAEGVATITATSGALNTSARLVVALKDILYVSSRDANAVYVWDAASTVSGPKAPSRTIQGDLTQLLQPLGLYIAPHTNRLYAATRNSDGTTGKVLIFTNASSAGGNTAPLSLTCAVSPPSQLLSGITGDETRDLLFLADNQRILSWNNASTVQGDVCAERSINGPSTDLGLAEGLFDDSSRNRLYEADIHQSAVNSWDGADTVTGDVVPATIKGNKTDLAQPVGVVLDVTRDKLYVAESANDEILVWDNASSLPGCTTQVGGCRAPDRVISGVATQVSQPCHLALDPVRDELYVGSFSSFNQNIVIFANASSANGNVAPVRVLETPDTTPCGVALDTTR